MAKVRLIRSDAVVGEFDFREKLSLGRDMDNDVHLDDGAVSQHHAIIRAHEDHFRLEDLGSTNGTRVNDRRAGKLGLRQGDVITIGPFRLEYEGPDAPRSFRDTMVLKLEEVARDGDTRVRDALEQSGGDLPEARVEVLSGKNAGETLPLEEDNTPVGVRGTQVAAVSRRRDGYYLVPVDGGLPRINGREGSPTAVRLEDRDEMEIAGVRLAFREGVSGP